MISYSMCMGSKENYVRFSFRMQQKDTKIISCAQIHNWNNSTFSNYWSNALTDHKGFKANYATYPVFLVFSRLHNNFDTH